MENNGKPQNLIEVQNSFTLFLFWSPGYARMRVFAHRCVPCMYLYQETQIINSIGPVRHSVFSLSNFFYLIFGSVTASF